MKKSTFIVFVSLVALLLFSGWLIVRAANVIKGQPQYLYQWYSTAPSRVSVDPNTGYIIPLYYGQADICAQLKSDLSVKFCNTVTVN